ncbi:MAG: hypothetical protein SOV26_04065 [Candidatus Onthovivens sp.]|nr:hypothetical protein [Candidatus Onthovivens sp.]
MEQLNDVKIAVQKLLNSEGFELFSFKLDKKNKSLTLSIVVDREQDISMDDIVQISEKVSDLLDKHDFCEGAYTLDLSSLGAEKPIKIEKINNYVGRYIFIHIVNPIDGYNSFEGTLVDCDDDSISLEIRIKTRKKIIKILKNNIDLCRFAIKF